MSAILLLSALGLGLPARAQSSEHAADQDQQQQVIEQMMMERLLMNASGNVAAVQQAGQGHTAEIVQQGGQGNAAGITQYGTGNEGQITQEGDDNETYIVQKGRDNYAKLSVLANSTSLMLVQQGNEHYYERTLGSAYEGQDLGTILQTGARNTIVETGTPAVPLKIEQRGADMKLFIEHK